jgi:hypothetical protein
MANIILNKKDKKKALQLQNIDKDKKSKNKLICPHCGQQLPWFCVCYLNNGKKF